MGRSETGGNASSKLQTGKTRRRVVVGVVVFLAGAASLAFGQEAPMNFGALANLDEPLELGRQVRSLDPNRLEEALLQGNRQEQLGAIRGAVWLAAPEHALSALAEVAAQDDPLLAPEAVAAALRITERIDPLVLEDRELYGELTEAAEAFAAIAEDTSARRDLRQGAGFVAAALQGANAPGEESAPEDDR